MPDARVSEGSFFHMFAEIAGAPMTSEASFQFCVSNLAEEITSNKQTDFWESVEARIFSSFPRGTIDEFTAMRDWIWLHGREDQNRISMLSYLNGLSAQLLQDFGSEHRPRLQQSNQFLRAADNPHRAARTLLFWLSRVLPRDLLVSVLEQRPATNQINMLSNATQRLLEIGYAEPHLHLGASMSFDQFWPCVLNQLGNRTFKFDMFQSRNSFFDHGRGMAIWLLRAALIRIHLARFLKLEHSYPDFHSYMLRDGEEKAVCSGIKQAVGEVLKPRLDRKYYHQTCFRALQDIYRRIANPGTVDEYPNWRRKVGHDLEH
ncbi:MAG: hypothetical protein AAF483_15400, partial [Planctomycetota bacterium]